MFYFLLREIGHRFLQIRRRKKSKGKARNHSQNQPPICLNRTPILHSFITPNYRRKKTDNFNIKMNEIIYYYNILNLYTLMRNSKEKNILSKKVSFSQENKIK